MFGNLTCLARNNIKRNYSLEIRNDWGANFLRKQIEISNFKEVIKFQNGKRLENYFYN